MTGSTASGPGDRGSTWPGADPGATGDTIAAECPWCRTAEPDGRTCLNCGRVVGPPSDGIAPTPTPAVAPVPPAQAANWPPPPPPPIRPVPHTAVVVDPTLVARQARLRALQERARQTDLRPARPLVVLVWVVMAAVGIALVAISINS